MFQLIAGPCVIESEEMVLSIAARMKTITDELGIPYTFKASFDKANRTSLSSFRGPGLEEGLRILKKVKDTYGLPVCTDIHEPCAWSGSGCVSIKSPRWWIFCKFRPFSAVRLICWWLLQRPGGASISKRHSSLPRGI